MRGVMMGVVMGVACACVCAGVSFAQHAGDVILRVRDGRIETGGLSASAFTPERVFESTLGLIAPDFASDPGFDNFASTFASGSRTFFRVHGPLREWNGSGLVLANDERMEIARSTLSVLTPTTPGTIEGFGLSVGANGQWHRHYEFTLLAGTSGVIDDGVYVLGLSLWNDALGMSSESDVFWIVFDRSAQAGAVDDAVAWIRENEIDAGGCDTIDFNNDELFPDDADLADFLSVLAGGPCGTEACNDIDFNNDGLFPDDADLVAFLTVLAGGQC